MSDTAFGRVILILLSPLLLAIGVIVFMTGILWTPYTWVRHHKWGNPWYPLLSYIHLFGVDTGDCILDGRF